MKTQFNLKSFWLVLSFLLIGAIAALGQTTFELSGPDWEPDFPFEKDGIILTDPTDVSDKDAKNNCNNGEWADAVPNDNARVLSFASGDYLRIDVGEGNTIESIRFLAGRNSSGSGSNVSGQYAFSADNATWEGHTNISIRGYDYCSEITATAPEGSRYAHIGRAGVGGVNPSSNAEFRLYYVIVTLAGPSCTEPTKSFASGEIITDKIIGDKFTNAFTSQNTSPTTWRSLDESIATVAADGTVTIVGEGTVQIEASKAEDGTYCAVKEIFTIEDIAALPCTGTALNTTVEAPTDATEDGFTANWNAVTGAVSYTLYIYSNNTVVQTLAGLTGTTANVFGLQPETDYTFTIKVIGNGTTLCTGEESAKSTAITTLEQTTPPPPSTLADCPVLLYHTDFSDWTAVTNQNTSGNELPVTTGGGAGFTITTDVSVIPGQNRLVYASTSSRTLTFAPLAFVNGGSVTIRGKNTTGSSMEGIEDATAVVDAVTGAPIEDFGDIENADYHVTFTLPAGFNGTRELEYVTRGEIYEITVCTNPPTSGCMLSTYPMSEGTVSFSAPVGGSSNKQFVELKGFNLTGDVTVAISGTDAGRFSIPYTTVVRATVSGGIMIPITFTSSVLPGTHNATITFSSGSCAEVSVNLVGNSVPVGGGCAILTSTAMQIFSSRLITPTTKSILVSAAGLTGNLTLSLTGTGAGQFSLSQTTMTAAEAQAGKLVDITYMGGSEVGNHSAELVLTGGACSITIPLDGRTVNYLPSLWTLTLNTIPPEGGMILTDIAGPQYPSGTRVRLTAIAQPGYRFVRWQDISSYSPSRTVLMDADKTITAIFEISDTGGAVGDLEAYDITVDNVYTQPDATGFTANWKLVPGAPATTKYTVRVYEQDADGQPGAEITAAAKTVTNSNTVAITGLTPGKAYYYQVVADTTIGDTSEMMGGYPIGGLQSIICGQD